MRKSASPNTNDKKYSAYIKKQHIKNKTSKNKVSCRSRSPGGRDAPRITQTNNNTPRLFSSIEVQEKIIDDEYKQSPTMDIKGKKTLSPSKEILLTNKKDKNICDTPKFDK